MNRKGSLHWVIALLIGYGLAEDEKSYVEILTEEGNFKSNNFAVNGRTSTVLLEDLQKPSEKKGLHLSRQTI